MNAFRCKPGQCFVGPILQLAVPTMRSVRRRRACPLSVEGSDAVNDRDGGALPSGRIGAGRRSAAIGRRAPSRDIPSASVHGRHFVGVHPPWPIVRGFSRRPPDIVLPASGPGDRLRPDQASNRHALRQCPSMRLRHPWPCAWHRHRHRNARLAVAS